MFIPEGAVSLISAHTRCTYHSPNHEQSQSLIHDSLVYGTEGKPPKKIIF